MTFLTIDRVACSAPDGTPLFTDLTFSLGRETLGLVGRNGAGKSTLLRAIAGHVPVSEGTIVRQGRVGLLHQLPPDEHASVAAALGLSEQFARLERITEGRFEDDDFDLADWTLAERFEKAAALAGFADLDPQRTLASFSGGQRTRLMLTGLLMNEPDVLLLDEPTNNLDEAGRKVVADLLDGWSGGALVASHDRELLRLADRIVELTGVGIHMVGGGWDAFDEQRSAERARASAALERSEDALRHARREKQQEAEKQARRDSKGRKDAARGGDPKILLGARRQRAEESGGRQRKLGDELVGRVQERLDVARRDVEVLAPIHIDLPPCHLPPGHTLIEAHGLACTRGGRRLFGPLDLVLRGPQRIAISGPNGSGKTSLIRILAGIDRPDAGDIRADTVRFALLDQHVSLLGEGGTVLDAYLRLNPDADRHAAHAALARFGFRNAWAQREIAGLSGGERMRLALACLFTRKDVPWLLVLDEPTNHLDLASVEMLEQALRGYDGAILCVSHDGDFREAMGLGETILLGEG
ncbi:MAG: ABC-F family ATP-binding cassette domain-containing protein [Novosphingobium sp.]|uniref:ABC-F family ATP-binding cassette domain-containing protein n=1 Tax=Novosphingobium sp. TaxID=1874826 RepID=UPI0012C29609|nr:ABC-F family ATP-binding cassette domain-containing protein [Novosphingobium sp.]MPS68808.1 ABC-F family ATP-binding cassette domain-containing protein [Novosphingobium sp.]